MKKTIPSIILFTLLIFSQQSFAQGDQLFRDSIVHEIRLSFEEDNFFTILSQNYDNFYPDIPYSLANASIDGTQVDSIGVRLKGFSSTFITTDKKSIKLDFNEFIPGRKYDGLRKVNLNNGEADPAIQRDILAYDLMRESGVNAPRTAYTKVFLNDEYWGLYLLVEQIDKIFLKENFGNNKGNLFKNVGFTNLEWLGFNATAYQADFELKSDSQPQAWERFINLMDIINNSSDANFKNQISEIFDVDYYLKILAVDVVSGNWDSYLDHGRNFYLYEDSVTQIFKWIPWDYNLAMGGKFSGFMIVDPPINIDTCQTILNGTCPYPSTDSILLQVMAADDFCCSQGWDEVCQDFYNDFYDYPRNMEPASYDQFPLDISNSDKVLIRRILAIPAFQERYYQHWCSLIEDNFTAERLFPLIDFNGNLIREDLANDNNYPWAIAAFEQDLDQGNDYRNDIVINEFSASNDSLSGLSDPSGEYDDWIELYNNTGLDIDLSNAYLTDNPDNIKKWQFPLGTTLAPEEYLIVWADEDGNQPGLHANFKLSRLGEFIQLTDFDSVLDSLTYGAQMVNLPSARLPNGTGPFVPQLATFGLNNESTTSTQTANTETFRVFPNPAAGHFSVVLSNNPAPGTRLSIYNGIGQVVLNRTLSKDKTIISVDDLVAGNYFLRVDGMGVVKLQIF